MAFGPDFRILVCVLGAGVRSRALAALRYVARGTEGRRGARGAAPGAFLSICAFLPRPVPLRPRGAPERSALAVAVSRALGHHFDGFWGPGLTLGSATRARKAELKVLPGERAERLLRVPSGSRVAPAIAAVPQRCVIYAG